MSSGEYQQRDGATRQEHVDLLQEQRDVSWLSCPFELNALI